MNYTNIINVLEKFAQKKVLVIGDLMLDQYSYGKVSRISPEAPVPVFVKSGGKHVLGGAGNVAANLKALGAKVWVVSLLGKDEAGAIAMKLFDELKISRQGVVVDASRPTTVKHRFVAQGQQLLRADLENYEQPKAAVTLNLLSSAAKILPKADAVIFSDYAKGTISEGLAKKVIFAARRLGKKIIADIKPANKKLFCGADLLTPNLKEGKEITGLAEPKKIGRQLAKQYRADVLLTMGGDGILAVGRNGKEYVASAAKMSVSDVSGAGDTVTAVSALALSCGLPLNEIAELANIAGEIKVQKSGTATVSAAELAARLRKEFGNATEADIHPKVWGYEKWLENNDKYCCKILSLNKGYQCSLHYHKDKDETFFITRGKVRMEVGKKTATMSTGDFVRILPGTNHRFTGIEDSEILEISTHHEESDSYRIEPSRMIRGRK